MSRPTPAAIDLTLPETNDHAVEGSQFNHRTKQCCAVYFHVSLPLTAMTDLIALLNSQINTPGSDVMCPAPNSDKIGRPLMSSFVAHRHIGTTTVFHPWYYIAVVEKEFEQLGVVLVSMGHSKDAPVQRMWLPVQAAGSAFATLQISHGEWSKLEDEYAHIQEVDIDSGSASSDDDLNAPYCPDYAIGIYILNGVSEDDVLDALGRRDAVHAKAPFPYGIQGHITPSSTSLNGFKLTTAPLVSELPEAGSAECNLDAYDQRAVTFAITEYMTLDEEKHGIHDSMFFIADRPDVTQDGLLLVQINRETERPVVFQAQRVPASNPETIQMFVKIDAGLRPFHLDHWAFVLQCKKEDDAWRIAELIDPENAERVHGDEKMVVVSDPGERMEPRSPTTVDMTVKPWPVVMHHERFKHNLHKHFFVYADAAVDSKDDEVTVVDAEWSPNAEDIAEGVEMLELRKETRTMQVKVGEAYEVLCKLADGVMQWPVPPKDGA